MGTRITIQKYLIVVHGLQQTQQPNSASDGFSKLPSRRRQEISTFAFGSAVERSILDRASVQIPHPVCCFFFRSSANPKYGGSNPPVPAFLLFFFSAVICTAILFVVLLYTIIVG